MIWRLCEWLVDVWNRSRIKKPLLLNVADNSHDFTKTLRSGGDIDALANQVDRLARATADTLRDDPTLRERMVNEGRALIATLDSYRKTDSMVDDMIGEVRDYYQA